MQVGNLEQRVALVTGAGSGIGRASAAAFAAGGAQVAVVDMDPARAQETVELIGRDRGAAVRADVTRSGDVQAAVRACVERFGRLDFVHNNAGISDTHALLHELGEDDWDRILDVNLRGAWLTLKHAIAHMRSGGGGSIVNTASVAGQFGFSRLGAYCASKAGLISLTKVAAVENAGHGIRVNAVCPGMTETEMTRGAARGPLPSGRMGAADEIAAAVVWLCSDAASYVNGASLAVDGGWSAMTGPRAGRADD